MTTDSLRLLLVEDNLADAGMVVREIQRAGFNLDWRRVETEVDFCREIETLPDLVISDFAMPQFDGMRALTLLRARRLDIPFILVSGTLGEDTAVLAMKLGANDYLLKDRIARLGTAVTHVMDEKRLRKERREMEESLRKAETRLKQAVEASNIGPWEWDTVSDEVFFSQEWKRQIGYSDEELPNVFAEWESRVHPDNRPTVIAAVAAGRNDPGAGFNFEFRLRHKNGSYRWIHSCGMRPKESGDQTRMLGCHIDITDRKLLEESLRQSQKMEAIGLLAGGVAHDFNNILAIIIMEAELARTEENLAGETAESLRQIHAAAQRAANLTRQLLAFSRRQMMRPKEVNLNELVTDLARMLHRIVGEDINLQLDLHFRPLIIRADSGMLDQALLNLVVNARDAMANGGLILIQTTESKLDEAAAGLIPDAKPGHYARVCVTDTGTGIAAEHLPRIFEPFFTTKEVSKGTGLGLATVFGVVKQHNGFIEVESETGRGTTFNLFFPVVSPSDHAFDENAAGAPTHGAETVLVVEDDPGLRTLVCTVLDRHGYDILQAGDGFEALQLWRRHNGKIHLLFSDMVLPGGLDGQELASRLRIQSADLRVIFTSGYNAEFAGAESTLPKNYSFIHKPFTPHELLKTVRQCLDAPTL